MTPRSAFTLLEMMVGVGVVAVLLALALPALTASRGSAERALCAANLRELGLLTGMYAEDHGGDTHLGHLWNYAYSMHVYDDYVPGHFGWGWLITAGLADPGSLAERLACPSRRDPSWLVDNAARRHHDPLAPASDAEAHYAMRPMLDETARYGWRHDPGKQRWSDGPARRSDLSPRRATFVDAAGALDIAEGTHRTVINAAFADGHVSTHPLGPVVRRLQHLPTIQSGTRDQHRVTQTDLWTDELDH